METRNYMYMGKYKKNTTPMNCEFWWRLSGYLSMVLGLQYWLVITYLLYSNIIVEVCLL